MGTKKFLEKLGVIEESEDPRFTVEVPIKPPTPTIQPKYDFSSSASSDILDQIRRRIETSLASAKKAINGVDFLSIIQSIEGTKSLIADEASRFKTAIMFAKTMNASLNKDEIISSADYYVQSLDTIKNNFTASTDKANKNIEEQRTQLINTQDKMNQLKSELAELNVKSVSLEKEIEESTKKTTEAANAFDVVYNEIREKLLKDKEKIIQYI